MILDVQLWELGTQRLQQGLSETILVNTLTDVIEFKKKKWPLEKFTANYNLKCVLKSKKINKEPPNTISLIKIICFMDSLYFLRIWVKRFKANKIHRKIVAGRYNVSHQMVSVFLSDNINLFTNFA